MKLCITFYLNIQIVILVHCILLCHWLITFRYLIKCWSIFLLSTCIFKCWKSHDTILDDVFICQRAVCPRVCIHRRAHVVWHRLLLIANPVCRIHKLPPRNLNIVGYHHSLNQMHGQESHRYFNEVSYIILTAHMSGIFKAQYNNNCQASYDALALD